jgi:TPR repeat protein
MGGIALDQAKAFPLYQRGCDLGDASSCYYAGIGIMAPWPGVTKDAAKAVLSFERACKGGSAWGCYALAPHYYAGSVVAVDQQKSFELFSRACDGGVGAACGDVGNFYYSGASVMPKDAAKALSFYEKGCLGQGIDYGSWPCRRLGEARRDGWGGAAIDGNKALEAFTRACDRGDGDACAAGADLHVIPQAGLPKDLLKAFPLCEKGCALKSAHACEYVGGAYKDGWNGKPVDGPKSLDGYAKGCELGSTTSCTMAGYVLANPPAGLTQDLVKAVGYYQRACEAKQGTACGNLADLTVKGLGGLAVDPAKSETLYRKACFDLKDGWSCHMLGTRYSDGFNGFPKSADKSLAAWQQGCAVGATTACDDVAKAGKKP